MNLKIEQFEINSVSVKPIKFWPVVLSNLTGQDLRNLSKLGISN